MSVSQKFMSDRHIHDWRVQEWRFDDMCNEIKADQNHLHKAQWEGRTDNILM